ncbi:MAG: WYL domain-containing protein [Hyphomicrobiaceae bacterium]|nr:WYL domain-containing protein [Hyphomicrobiaceae bacterium]
MALAIEMLRRIPPTRKISAAQLRAELAAAGYERNVRSIQRHLEALSQYFEIERDDRSKPYGYRWKERAQGFSVPGLDAQQSLLLALAEQHLANLLPANLMKSMEGFFDQARRNLDPYTGPRREREWLAKVRVVSTSQPLLPPQLDPKVIEEVSNALFGNRWLEVEYRNASGWQKKHDVMPLGLAQQGPRLYLVCRYDGYDNERSLALHRIVSARATTLEFKRPKDFDLAAYDDDGRFGFGEGRRVRLTFCISKDAGFHLLETPLSEDQTVTETDEHYDICATVVDSAQLEWWLRGFGEELWDVRREALDPSPPRVQATANE